MGGGGSADLRLVDGNGLDEALLVLHVRVSGMPTQQRIRHNSGAKQQREEGTGGGVADQLSHGTACNGHVDFKTIADDGGGNHLVASASEIRVGRPNYKTEG